MRSTWWPVPSDTASTNATATVVIVNWNGERLLRPVFARVARRSLNGEIRVTEADAVVRYVLSVQGAPEKIVGAKLRAEPR